MIYKDIYVHNICTSIERERGLVTRTEGTCSQAQDHELGSFDQIGGWPRGRLRMGGEFERKLGMLRIDPL